ncbi:hypothetical protein B5M09_005288 [Aphanomyces astaci]|uniref:Uncharacterized protein n=1 Tax=Aphanomyces astaci TaxID=112090 RepID=A0A425CWM4_APHAT|nr:hypothetical protein B5M09_005288 [Aphanomyces astaci]
MTIVRILVYGIIAGCVDLAESKCPTHYAPYKAVVTVSKCTSKDVAFCIVDGQYKQLPLAATDTFSFNGQNVRVGQPFDGLVAELPAAAVSADFTYASVDVGDLSANTKSFYRTNRANLTSAKLPPSLTTLYMSKTISVFT